MEAKHCKVIRGIKVFLGVIFLVYGIFLLRITLFKQVRLYNLFAAIGTSERSISLIPFYTTIKMIREGISLGRILENVLGNIILFVPFGMVLPTMIKREDRVILYGMFFSIFIELTQLLLAMESTDCDDVIFNTLGVLIGYGIYKGIKKCSRSTLSHLLITLTLVGIVGSLSFAFLLVNHTDLLIISPKKVIVENGELVQDFIETPYTFSGKLIDVRDSRLIVENTIVSASEERESMEYEITPESRNYLCHNQVEFFFSAVTGEHKRYEAIDPKDFIARGKEQFHQRNNGLLWSGDEKKIDQLIVVEWVE